MLGDEAFEGIEVILPTLAVENSPRSTSAAAALVLETQRTAHTDNDLTITDTATDTLFLGDLLFSVHVPTLDGSIKGWLALLDRSRPARRPRASSPGTGRMPWSCPRRLTPEQRYLARDRRPMSGN